MTIPEQDLLIHILQTIEKSLCHIINTLEKFDERIKNLEDEDSVIVEMPEWMKNERARVMADAIKMRPMAGGE